MTEVDARGMRCPWPALRLAKAMRSNPAVRLHADDPAVAGELAAMGLAHGWRIERTGPATFHVISATG